MEEKILKDMASTLEAIKVKLDRGWIGIDTVPLPERPWLDSIHGPTADPGPPYLLDKARLAILKISKIDTVITELEKKIGLLKLQHDLLKEEYNIK
jgi:hypothetical protein